MACVYLLVDGFESVYRQYGGPVHGYLARLTGDAGTAEELCQETFVRYLRHRDGLQGRNGQLGAWLFRVATNLVRDRYRRRRAGPLETEPADTTHDGAGAAEARDLDAHVRREVERLPADLRAAFLLRAHHDLAYARVAEALDVSVRTAKERFRRAREILAHRLAPLFEEEHR